MHHRTRLLPCVVGPLLAVLLAACAAGRSWTEPGPPGGGAGLRIEIAPEGMELRSRSPRVGVRREDGLGTEVVDRWIQKEEDRTFAPLPAGSWLVSAKLPLACPGHAIYVHESVVLEDGLTTVVRLSPPPGDARLELDVEKGSPPFVLLLLDPEAMTPRTLRSLGAYYERPANPDVHFEVMSDGRSWLDLPPLPAGRYVALVCANDWQDGDPAIGPRTVPVTLAPGATGVLHISEKLTVLRFDR